MKTRLLIAALFALSIGALSANAAQEGTAATAAPEVGSETLMTLSATVTAINKDAREVTLTDADGNSQVISVSEAVKNLPQLAVGDQVDITYFESITFEVLAPDQAQAGVTGGAIMETAAPGQKPAAAATSELQVVATVEAIDKAATTVTLKGPAGNTKTVMVRDPKNLDKVAVGDQLLITMTRAVAVGVNGAPSGK